MGKDELKYSQAFPDLIRHHGRFYLAFRSAPSHFPSDNARIHIFSTQDTKDVDQWQIEHTIRHNMDIRDPHFLQFKGELYLFFMSHSFQWMHHEPECIYYIKKERDSWSKPTAIPISKSGFWGIRAFQDKVYISIYTRNNGGHRKSRSHLQFITSSDLVNWDVAFDSPLAREKMNWYQTSETAFAFDKTGNLFGTIRSIMYPNLNFSIPSDDNENWKIRVDTHKCDGPNLFSHNDQYYLIARRSLFNRLPSEPFRLFHNLRKFINILRYSFSRKRTAIYGFDQGKLEIEHITDLPSHGDTGYSAIAPLDTNRYLLIYYSSDITEGKDISWLRGQMGRTKLYSMILTIN